MKALLVMDMVNEYIYGERPLIPPQKRPWLIATIKKLVDRAHEKGISVIYVNSAFRKSDPIMKVIGYRLQAMKGTKGSRVIPELKPLKKDYVLEKRGYDGFWESGLKELLARLGVVDLYLTGQQIDCCIRETGVTAAHLGYTVHVVEDCCDTSREMGRDSSLRFMKTCVGEIVSSKDLNW